ncbi:TIR domain-containing protein [Leptolyngbya sp. AN03gr2]|uniref:TIR domain-containing protein n=1 Tax=unclassified Leptolyngbya TaxID=2650499 RepID=UPI003D3151A5
MTEAAIRVFFSYSHQDEEFKDELVKHLSILQRQGVISGWHDRMLAPGYEWNREIDEQLKKADIVLLMVSSDFLASDYCWDVEMQKALKRHEEGEACVIPILLRQVDWENAPFAKLQALPKNAKPIKSWSDQDEAFKDVAKGIRMAVSIIRERQREPQKSQIHTANNHLNEAQFENASLKKERSFKVALAIKVILGIILSIGLTLSLSQSWRNTPDVRSSTPSEPSASSPRIDPQTELQSKTFFNEAVKKQEQGDTTGAIADYDQAIKLNPEFAKAYYFRGELLRHLGNNQGAIDNFQKAAELYMKQGNYQGYQDVTELLKGLR